MQLKSARIISSLIVATQTKEEEEGTYRTFSAFQKLLNDNSDALVSQHATDDAQMRHSDEV